MKKNLALRIASGLMLSCLLTSCVISGTFAKYTSSATATDTARVAKWDIELNDAKITTNTFTFNLFDTINDTKDGNDETDVADTVIAPGTQGSFEIKLENLSEVNAVYSISFTESFVNTADMPIVYSLTGADDSWGTINSINVPATAIVMTNGTATVTVYWQWAFEQTDVVAGDIVDTNLGSAEYVAVTVTADITVTQVD